ncbi:VC1465 family Xer recombination activation factor [Polaromonas sp. UBA4122]|uniref:VC1465 family Xer recombination activation factor n=1 Tax=Polaromonas sp. UBA4122 TaxID=1947074 RepID=UPI0025D67C28|nr:VC1465 family Xer recombination activation factor [Polaromonas sp. UBA4122]
MKEFPNEINYLQFYTSWNIKAKGKKTRQCRADRMEHALRFRAMLAELGLPHPDAAQLLHVSLRTLQNWLSGRHEVPYAAYKLLRLLRYMELPGQAWSGWHFSRGQLVTPEGRTISGKDGSWWSLLVRQAHSFGELYRELQLVRMSQLGAATPRGIRAEGRAADSASIPGLVSVSTSATDNIDRRGHNGVIMEPWPTISDFPLPSMLTPAPAVSVLESALTPCSALPSMPIFGTPAEPLQALTVPAKPGQSLPLLADSWLNRAYLPHRLHLPKQAFKSSPSSNAGRLPGLNGHPASSDLVGGAA